MVEKAKIFYFSVFILLVFAFIFHVVAMGYPNWKKASPRNPDNSTPYNISYVTIGLFTRCHSTNTSIAETCFANKFPGNKTCDPRSSCLPRADNSQCSCDYLPSTKGIAACTILAAIFLGFVVILLFIHSVNSSETHTLNWILGLIPLVFILLALIFIFIALVLVGSYLSRDMMHLIYNNTIASDYDFDQMRQTVRDQFRVRVDWSTGLEIISIFFTFVSFLLYGAFLFIFSRSS